MIKSLTRGAAKLFHFVELSMIKALTRKAIKLFHFVGTVRVEGPHGKMSGNCSGLSGNCSKLSGNCSGLYGNCTGLRGDLDKCLLQDEDRTRRVDISDLIKD